MVAQEFFCKMKQYARTPFETYCFVLMVEREAKLKKNGKKRV